MTHDERETLKLYVAIGITVVLVIALFWAMSEYSKPTPTPYNQETYNTQTNITVGRKVSF